MPNRIPTPTIPTPTVRRSASAQKPAAPMPSVGQKSKAETMLRQEIAKGNTNNFDKTREAIAKKTGMWPNGKTN